MCFQQFFYRSCWLKLVFCDFPDVKKPFLPYGEPYLCNDFILKDRDYIDCCCIKFACHCILEQVLLDTDLLNNVILWKEVVQPTKKLKSVVPHKLKLEKTISKTKKRQKNKKFRSVSTQIPGESSSVKIQTHESTKSRSGKNYKMTTSSQCE